MKILVISLLRIGDFLQTLPVLHGLRAQFKIRRLDVLTHAPAMALAPMIGEVDKWWTLDRDELQAGLGQAEIPLLTSFSLLREQLDAINLEKYDCIINLTQTEYSGWIAGYLETGSRAGLNFAADGSAQLHSPWFKYLDDHTSVSVPDIFHYSDIFYYGSGLRGAERVWQLRETDRGRAEVAALAVEYPEKIVLQLLTSDEKKTWPETSWLGMLTQLQLFRPQAQFILLGAPNEESRLNSLLQKTAERGLRATKAVLSLEGAFSLLKQSQLLISADTSIKHLANAASLPVLELSLGSSDLRRTGAYKPDSLIIQAAVECAPCPHSSPCRKPTHECALQLPPEAVSAAAHQLLNGDWRALTEIAREFAGEVTLLRTRVLASGFWLACNLGATQPEKLLETMVDRCAWKFFLDREHTKALAQFGSAGVQMRRELAELLPDSNVGGHLDFLEARAGAVGETAASLLSSVRARRPKVAEIRRFLTDHQPQSRALPWLEQLIVQDSEAPLQIGGLRRVHTELEQSVQRANVKLKLIRSLKSQLTETK